MHPTVQWVSTVLERPLGPVALYGLILAITRWIWLSDMGWYSKTGGGYLSMGSCCKWVPCEGKKDLNSNVLFWLLSVTCCVRPLLDVVVRRGILVQPPSVEGPDIS